MRGTFEKYIGTLLKLGIAKEYQPTDEELKKCAKSITEDLKINPIMVDWEG